MICWHRQNVSCLQIVSVHHPGDVTAMFAPDLHFLTCTPFFGCQNAEALQKILHLEIFWGFRTRTAPAGGGQYLSGGGADPRRDMLLMTTCTLTLTDEEFTGFLTEINQTALKYMDIGVKEGSRQRQITLISSPTDGPGSR
jgi:hypothetical protein